MSTLARFRLRHAAPRGGAVSRAAAWLLALAAVILLWQQFAACAHHEHELAAASQHCVACTLHAQPHAAPPATAPASAPPGWVLLHPMEPAAAARLARRAAAYLLPPAHAPPLFLAIP